MPIDKDELRKLPPEERLKRLKELEEQIKREKDETELLERQTKEQLEFIEAERAKLREPPSRAEMEFFRPVEEAPLEETVRQTEVEAPPEENIQYAVDTYDKLKGFMNYDELNAGQMEAAGEIYNKLMGSAGEDSGADYQHTNETIEKLKSAAADLINDLRSKYKPDDRRYLVG